MVKKVLSTVKRQNGRGRVFVKNKTEFEDFIFTHLTFGTGFQVFPRFSKILLRPFADIRNFTKEIKIPRSDALKGGNFSRF
ncbi:unnamed protein product [Allacma fusca]|uniref:Uncharacterized protein n=1 Tax=Allacma fusca TaxID=39272 RepID=A0A8J2NT24_9HEXA|nr:unnamed protein product [Allacma fusca]